MAESDAARRFLKSAERHEFWALAGWPLAAVAVSAVAAGAITRWVRRHRRNAG